MINANINGQTGLRTARDSCNCTTARCERKNNRATLHDAKRRQTQHCIAHLHPKCNGFTKEAVMITRARVKSASNSNVPHVPRTAEHVQISRCGTANGAMRRRGSPRLRGFYSNRNSLAMHAHATLPVPAHRVAHTVALLRTDTLRMAASIQK